MAINTLQNYAAALKQTIVMQKNSSSCTGLRALSVSKVSAGEPPVFSTISAAAAGVVPVAGDTGFPSLNSFSGVGRIAALSVAGTGNGRYILYDRLFHCGPYNTASASTTLASQPSFSSRVPGGTDYAGLQLWLESNTCSGAPALTVTYTDQSGNAGASTSFTLTSLGGVNGSCQQVPLAAGDSGLSKIESVSTTAVGSGTFNLFVARPLCIVRVEDVEPRLFQMEELGLIEIFPTSALALLMASDTTTTGIMELGVEIASG